MAKGYPDYFGQSIWPKYGTPTFTTISQAGIGNTETTILEITSQGVLRIAHFYGDQADENGSSFLRLYIDGTSVWYASLAQMLTIYGAPQKGMPFILTSMNYVTGIWAVVLDQDVPFRSGAKVTFRKTSGNAVSIQGYAAHYVVT